MPNTNIEITELDFDRIKEKLRDFFRNQPEFKDYDFEGAGLSILLDMLAYNTHYAGYYANTSLSETFLDSARQRGTIISRAKELNYIPESAHAASAQIRVQFRIPNGPNPAVIAKGTRFTANIDTITYTFVTTKSVNVVPVGDLYTADLTIHQGTFVENTFEIDYNSPDKSRFIIPNETVDTRFLTVYVKNTPANEESRLFTRARTIANLNGTSRIYYIEENERGFFEIKFGDNILGVRPPQGAQVIAQYLVTRGAVANGARVFQRADTIVQGAQAITITTLDPATGGVDKEDEEKARLLAPKVYQTQERAVTAVDYSAILRRDNPEIRSINVWGGEDNVPPRYGEIFIAARPQPGVVLSERIKQEIIRFVRANYSVVALRPRIVDPDFIYVIPTIDVFYDNKRGADDEGDIQEGVRTAVKNYFDTDLVEFRRPLRYTALVRAIDGSNEFIKNSQTVLRLRKEFAPILRNNRRYVFSFTNPVTPNSFTSDPFVIDNQQWRLRDVPVGNRPFTTGRIKIARTTMGGEEIYNSNIGSINYVTGEVILDNFAPQSLVVRQFVMSIFVKPNTGANLTAVEGELYDIRTNNREQVIALDENDITVNVILEDAD